jgi:hypothetical protein
VRVQKSLALIASLALLGQSAIAGPSPRTDAEFSRYVAAREASLDREPGLWIDRNPAEAAAARRGEVAVQSLNRNPVALAHGLAHDWVGAVFVPGATLASTLALVQDYDNHKRVYQPEVVDSKLISRQGNGYRVYLRLQKRKVITVLLNSEHEVYYKQIDSKRAQSRSYSRRIAEIDDPGTPSERELSPADDHGFLWKINSYWRFEERDGGVWIECEAISLSRDVPFGLGAIVIPVIRELPAESLRKTLEATRTALSRQ